MSAQVHHLDEAALGRASASIRPSMFNPSIHLAYQAPSERMSMRDMGLEGVSAPSHFGVTSPFPLASLEGVKSLRRDIFQPKVLDNFMTPSAISGPHAQLRGMAPKAAKFVYDFWTSPEVLNAVSQAAGEELVPVFDYELGHTNIQVPKGMNRREYAGSLAVDPYDKSAPAIEAPKEKAKPVVDYHRDAYPWVCVLMLSDVSGMVGGETEIKCGDGNRIRAIGPNIGSCVMMQGGYIEHCALPCHGARERITMVTSFRPKNKMFRDLTSLQTIRNCSNSFEMYDQYVHSRLDVLQETMDTYRSSLKKRRAAVEGTTASQYGLQQPTIDINEFEAITKLINDTLSNAVTQMPDYGTDPADVYTPKLDRSLAAPASKM